MHYTYVLRSLKDHKLYIGATEDLRSRFDQHQAGKVKSTAHRVPFEILFYEAYGTKIIAERRERYLKSSDGHKDIYRRLPELEGCESG